MRNKNHGFNRVNQLNRQVRRKRSLKMAKVYQAYCAIPAHIKKYELSIHKQELKAQRNERRINPNFRCYGFHWSDALAKRFNKGREVIPISVDNYQRYGHWAPIPTLDKDQL